jgi:hypothetical protein
VGHQSTTTERCADSPNVPDKTEIGLPGYSVTNATASQTINRNVDLFVGVQGRSGAYYVGTNDDDWHAAPGQRWYPLEGGAERFAHCSAT